MAGGRGVAALAVEGRGHSCFSGCHSTQQGGHSSSGIRGPDLADWFRIGGLRLRATTVDSLFQVGVGGV